MLPASIVMPRTYTHGYDSTHNDNQRIKDYMRRSAYLVAIWIRQGSLQGVWPYHFGGLLL